MYFLVCLALAALFCALAEHERRKYARECRNEYLQGRQLTHVADTLYGVKRERLREKVAIVIRCGL